MAGRKSNEGITQSSQNGEFDPTVYDRLKGMGAWLKTNGEAIYVTRPAAPYEDGRCLFTRKKNGALYALVLSKSDADGLPESIKLPPAIAGRVRHARLLGGGRVHMAADGEMTFSEDDRAKSAGGLAWAIELGR